MQKGRLIGVVFLLLIFGGKAQKNMNDFLEEKANKLREKTKKKTTDNWEKKQQEYDASNFNYAISFLDNSGLFEAEEKGGTFTSNLLGAANFASSQEISIEDRAYNNLKNGELLMAANKFNLAEQSFIQAKDLYERSGNNTSENYAQTISNLGLVYQSGGRFNKAKPFSEDAVLLCQNLENKGKLVVSINNNFVLTLTNIMLFI